ncbi:Urea active transporter-like protein [Gracilaria domingensis]|nr:Urea active transporter-like protein [Gracilaria domingensis]
MADCQYDWSTNTVPKLPTMLVKPKNKPLRESMVRVEIVPHLARRAQIVVGDVHLEDEDTQRDEDDSGVEVRRNERSLEASSQGVQDDTKRDEERRQIGVHAGERVDSGRATQDKHRSDNDISHERKHDEHKMRHLAPAGAHNLQKGVTGGRTTLDEHGQHGEEQNLDGGARRIPERARDTKLVGNGGETGLDGTTGRVEKLGVHIDAGDEVLQTDQADGEEAEGDTEGEHDDPAGPQRQAVLDEELILTSVLLKAKVV